MSSESVDKGNELFCGRWRTSRLLLREMERRGVRPSRISFNLCLGACVKAQPRRSQPVAKLVTGPRTPAGAGTAAPPAARPAVVDAVLDVLTELQGLGLSPDVVSYSSAAAVLSKAGEWEAVLGLLGAMEEVQSQNPTGDLHL